MIRSLLIASAVVTLAGTTGWAQPPAGTSTPMDARSTMAPMPPSRMTGGPAPMDFVHMAAQSDRFEREAGMMAVRRGHDPRVKQFGRRMERDHLMTAQALTRSLIRSHRRTPPTPQLDAEHRAMLSQARMAGPREFDRVYIDGQVAAHQRALELMQAYALNGSDPTLKRAADRAIPIIREHLQMAQSLRDSLRM